MDHASAYNIAIAGEITRLANMNTQPPDAERARRKERMLATVAQMDNDTEPPTMVTVPEAEYRVLLAKAHAFDARMPTIARTKPRTYARIKRSVAWRLMAKGRK